MTSNTRLLAFLALLSFLNGQVCHASDDGSAPEIPPLPQGGVHAELSFGHEHYSSPLVRIADEGPLLRIDGRNVLSGSFRRTALSGNDSVKLTDETLLILSGNYDDKRFSSASDLNLAYGNVDAILRWQLGTDHSLGFGPGYQNIRVAGQPFRQRPSLHADWTISRAETGYTIFVLDYGINRHAEQFTDLNSKSGIAVLRRQIPTPLPMLEEIAIEAGVGKETNLNGFHDLSSDQVHARASADWDAIGLKWSLTAMVQRARFKAALVDELPVRQDRFMALDLNCEYPLSKQMALRLDISRSYNRSNLPLFESIYYGNTLSLVANF